MPNPCEIKDTEKNNWLGSNIDESIVNIAFSQWVAQEYQVTSLKKMARLLAVFGRSFYVFLPDIDSNTLITTWYTRKDYLDRLKWLSDELSINVVELKKQKKVYGISFSAIYHSISNMRKIKAGIKKKFVLFVLFFYAENKLNIYVKRLHKTPNKYCAFNAAWGEENVLANHFNNKGVQTFSLEHALYFCHRKKIPLDFINYTNIPKGTKLLVWSKYVGDEIQNQWLKKDSIIVCGYLGSRSKIQSKNQNKTTSHINMNVNVILGRSFYNKSNFTLLKNISSSLKNREINVFPHPSNYEQIKAKHDGQFINIHSSLSSYPLSGREIFIVNNTSYLFELAVYGFPILWFNSSENELPESILKSNGFEYSDKKLMEIIENEMSYNLQAQKSIELSELALGLSQNNYYQVLS